MAAFVVSAALMNLARAKTLKDVYESGVTEVEYDAVKGVDSDDVLVSLGRAGVVGEAGTFASFTLRLKALRTGIKEEFWGLAVEDADLQALSGGTEGVGGPSAVVVALPAAAAVQAVAAPVKAAAAAAPAQGIGGLSPFAAAFKAIGADKAPLPMTAAMAGSSTPAKAAQGDVDPFASFRGSKQGSAKAVRRAATVAARVAPATPPPAPVAQLTQLPPQVPLPAAPTGPAAPIPAAAAAPRGNAAPVPAAPAAPAQPAPAQPAPAQPAPAAQANAANAPLGPQVGVLPDGTAIGYMPAEFLALRDLMSHILRIIADPAFAALVTEGPLAGKSAEVVAAMVRQALEVALIGPKGVGGVALKAVADQGFNNRKWRTFCLGLLDAPLDATAVRPNVADMMRATFPGCEMMVSYNNLWPYCNEALQEAQAKVTVSRRDQFDDLKMAAEIKKMAGGA